jgi:Spy/CpxP family protein refolding chaperone
MRYALWVVLVTVLAAPLWGQQRDIQQLQQMREQRMLQRRIQAIASGLDPVTISNTDKVDLTDEQKAAILQLEQDHAARMDEFQATREEAMKTLKEIEQLAQDPANRGAVPARVEQLERLAEPIVLANREFAGKVAAQLTVDQVRQLGLMDELMAMFPWSRGSQLQWLLDREMDPEKKKELIDIVRASDRKLLAEIHLLLTEEQLKEFAEVLERAGRDRRFARGNRRGGRGQQGNMVERMADRLDLNAEQREKFETLSTQLREKMQDLRREGNREGLREAFQEYREGLEKILTPEQLEKMQEMRQRMRGGRGGRRQR